MATRSKNKKRPLLWAALALAALTAAAMAGFFAARSRAAESVGHYFEADEFVKETRLYLLTRYWQARCAWDGADDPSALFLSDANALYYACIQSGEDLYTMAQTSSTPLSTTDGGAAEDPPLDGRTQKDSAQEPGAPVDGTQETAPLGTRGGLAVYMQEAANLIDRFNTRFRNMTDEYTLNWSNLYCTVVDNATGAVYAPVVDLSGVTRGASLDDTWSYLQITRYDAAGTLSYQETFYPTSGASHVETLTRLNAQADMKYLLGNSTNVDLFSFYDYVPPQDVTVILAVPRTLAGGDMIDAYASRERYQTRFLAQDRVYNIALLCAWALALLFGRKNGAGLGRGRLARLPLEASLGLLTAAGIVVRQPLYSFFNYAADGTIAEVLASVFSLDPPAGPVVAYALAFAAIGVSLGVGFAAALSIRQAVHVYGLRETLTHRWLCWHAVHWLWDCLRAAAGKVRDGCARLWRVATRVDLLEPADRTLVRLLTINFFILALICCFWFAGIFGILIYSVLLFLLLRGRLHAEQQNYQKLLDAARRMAAGDLTTPASGEMGMFDPLRDTLNELRAGFEKAVDEEVRSRNMKTELITNVSHDLKTPLTAIITYIGLLKDPALSEEARAQYIQTLDNKSQRLKRLIEDLFEISKAASGNAVMHYAEVDLASLLRQAACELEDAIGQSGVDFRWQMPEHRVPLILDGQKTYRIFENLLVNIIKYALPGTRAYITLTETPEGAVVECKNVSAAELNFDTAAITERFVRGDRSRSTEGSGLGLAIVKSFAELQGGAFSVSTDGDLFKATVFFRQGAPAPNTGTGGYIESV